MSDNEPGQKPPKVPKPPIRKPEGGNPQNNWKGVFVLAALVLVVLVAFYFSENTIGGGTKELTMAEFKTLVREKKIHDVTIYADTNMGSHVLRGKYNPKAETDPTAPESPDLVNYRVIVDLSFNRHLEDDLKDLGFPDVSTKVESSQYSQAILTILPFLVLLTVMYFLFRQQIRSAGRSAFSFGKSRAKMLSKDRNKITFKDVAGIDEAKDELVEIVEFLRDPRKFQRLGGRIPKGILMVGPPGTGKTLLAKAIAGEANVPFYGISGSDFVEMFVGVGASRVRDMFEQGKKTAPCLIFIDEIDAVGRSRGHGLGGGHDEREQTLNALLVEMDGIDTNEGVIIIAATNRKDVLDPALLRPGRFDREVHVHLPDIKGRMQILQVHAKKAKVHEGVDLTVVARGTPGFSGAELANLINEAALLAARRNADFITLPDLEEARDKVRWGRERRSMAMSEEDKKITAYHEAGHAVLGILLEHTDPLHKVTIIPRGQSLGMTMSLPDKDNHNMERREAVDDICMTMGGRVAEEVFLGHITSGAYGDIRQATALARAMVCEWGMSENLGMVQYGEQNDYVFLGREISKPRPYSEATAVEIDHEIRNLIKAGYDHAKDLIVANRDRVEAIALALLEYETLDGVQVKEIMETGKMNNPPPKNISPPSSAVPDESLNGDKASSKDKPGDGMLPGLQGAPAGA